MLRDNQILSIQEWPAECSGGLETCQQVIITIFKIFSHPLNLQNQDREVGEICGALAKADVVFLILNSLKYLTDDMVPIGISLTSRLIFSSESSKQFA